MEFSEKIADRSKSLYEYVSLIMVALYAALPAIMMAGPDKWGKAFKMFSLAEISALTACVLWCLLLFIIKIFSFSFKTAVGELKTSIVGFFAERKYAFLLFLMYILIAISAFLAPNRERAFLGTDFRPDGLMMHTAFLSLFVFSCGLKRRSFKKAVLAVYSVSFVLVSLVVAQQYFGIIGSTPGADKPDFLIPIEELYIRLGIRNGHFYKGLTGSFYNLNHMGYYIAVCSAIFSAFLICADKLWKKLVLIVLNAYAFWILIVNNTFGCYLAVFAVLVITMIVFAVKKSDTTRVALPIFVFLVVSIFTVLFPPPGGKSAIKSNFVSTTSDVKEIYNSEESAATAGSGRWEIWLNTIEMISEKPVLGFGPDNLKSEYTSREIKLDRAHNELLERAVSTGIPSAIFYLTAILLALICACKSRSFGSGDGYILAPIMAALTYFFSGMVGVFLFYTAGHLFIMLAMTCHNEPEAVVEIETENDDSLCALPEDDEQKDE